MIHSFKKIFVKLNIAAIPAWSKKMDEIPYPRRFSIQTSETSPGSGNAFLLETLSTLDLIGVDVSPIIEKWGQVGAEYVMLGSVVGVDAPSELSDAHLKGLRLVYDAKKPINYMDDYFIRMVLQRKHQLTLHAFEDFNDAVNTMEDDGFPFLKRELEEFIKENSYVRESTWYFAHCALRIILKSLDRAYNEAQPTAHPELVNLITIRDVGQVAQHIYSLRGDLPDGMELGTLECDLFLSTYHPSHLISIVMFIEANVIYNLKKRLEKKTTFLRTILFVL